MAGGGDSQPGNNVNPSYSGGSAPSTFDPKQFGTTLFSDLSRAYSAGPKVNPIANYTPLSGGTQGLINQGFQNNADLRSGLIGQLANGGKLPGMPDYSTGPVSRMAAGDYLTGGNPYLEGNLATTRNNTLRDVGSQFENSGRFGGSSYIGDATHALADSENAARGAQYNTDAGNMYTALGLQQQGAQTNLSNQVQARGLLDSSTAQALGYSGLTDANNRELTASNQDMWSRTNNQNFNHIAQYLSALTGSAPNDNTNRPIGLWDILGGLGTAATTFL
jgi:hypothetical protein